MSKQYCYVVYGVNLSRLSIDEIEEVKKNFKRVNQQGIAYSHDDKSVLFTSNNLADLHEIEINSGWAHSTNASKVKKGFTVYVVPNSNLIKKHPLTAFGVKFTAFSNIEYLENNQLIWTSETMNKVLQKQSILI